MFRDIYFKLETGKGNLGVKKTMKGETMILDQIVAQRRLIQSIDLLKIGFSLKLYVAQLRLEGLSLNFCEVNTLKRLWKESYFSIY